MKNTRKVNVNVSARKAEMMRRRRMFFKSLLVLGLSITAIVALWNKAHKTYICDINFVNDCIVYVEHPNGLEYGVTVDSQEEYKNVLKAKVTFNELTDWEKNYTINNIVPYEDGGELIINK